MPESFDNIPRVPHTEESAIDRAKHELLEVIARSAWSDEDLRVAYEACVLKEFENLTEVQKEIALLFEDYEAKGVPISVIGEMAREAYSFKEFSIAMHLGEEDSDSNIIAEAFEGYLQASKVTEEGIDMLFKVVKGQGPGLLTIVNVDTKVPILTMKIDQLFYDKSVGRRVDVITSLIASAREKDTNAQNIDIWFQSTE